MKKKHYLLSIVLSLIIVGNSYSQNELDENWTCSVAGQTVQVNPNGTFRIPNVSAPDQFGPGGPGTGPDFVSDDFVRVVCKTIDDQGDPHYAFSAFFQILQGQTVSVGEMTFTDTPPPQPISLQATTDKSTLTQLSETAQVTVTATLANSSQIDVTPSTSWTTYRVSNSSIATINANGLISTISKGIIFVTATNEGATAVTRLTVSPGDPLTTVEGFVQLPDGTPVENALVTLADFGVDLVSTDDEGRFIINQVPTEFSDSLTIRVWFLSSEDLPIFGLSPDLSLVAGGLTDGGIITLNSLGTLDTDEDGIVDDLEVIQGLDPNDNDSDDDFILDGNEDADQDGLPDFAETLLGTDPGLPDSDIPPNGVNDPDEDRDMDGLTDGQEIALGTNPFQEDTDMDSWSDEVENSVGSNPVDPESTPILTVVARPPVIALLPGNEGDGLAANTILASPPVSITIPGIDEDGLRPNTILGQPKLSLVLPGIFGESAIGPNITVAQPPIDMVLPDLGQGQGLETNIFVSSPPVSIGIPNLDGSLGGNITLALPPLFMVIPGFDPNAEDGLKANVTIAQPPIDIEVNDP